MEFVVRKPWDFLAIKSLSFWKITQNIVDRVQIGANIDEIRVNQIWFSLVRFGIRHFWPFLDHFTMVYNQHTHISQPKIKIMTQKFQDMIHGANQGHPWHHGWPCHPWLQSWTLNILQVNQDKMVQKEQKIMKTKPNLVFPYFINVNIHLDSIHQVMCNF